MGERPSGQSMVVLDAAVYDYLRSVETAARRALRALESGCKAIPADEECSQGMYLCWVGAVEAARVLSGALAAALGEEADRG